LERKANETKRVLYISYDGMTDPLGQSQVIPYLQHLSKEGYRFTILSFEKRVRYEKEGAVVRKLMEEAEIEWVPLFFTTNPPVLSKIWDRYRMEKTAERLHKDQPFQLVHCRSYVAAEVGLKLKKKYGVKMLFDMRGFWADEKVDNGQWDQEKIFYRQVYKHYKQKEEQFLRQADGIVSLTHAAKAHLLQQPSYQHLSIQVIPCCADLDHFNYESVNGVEVQKLKETLGIAPNAKVLTYLGSVGGWYMTREMFSFFRMLEQEHPEYIMLILTKDEPDVVRKEAAQIGVPVEKLFITYSDRKKLPQYLALSNWSIFFIRNTFSKTASSPTKHAEIMGMGIPVICNDIGDTGKIIEQTGTGLVVKEFTDQEYRQIIRRMYAADPPGKELIRQAATRYFDLVCGVQDYLNLYKNILN
jgi:glycosyltransferase involved in cell wall biosynthesis